MFAYLYAVFDLISITLVSLVAFKAMPSKLIARLKIDKATKTIIWHYFGILSIIVVLSYLLGNTRLYELGYHYGAIALLLPLMSFAMLKGNLVISGLIILQLVIWLTAQNSYINLFDVLAGELLLLSYLCMISVQLVKLLVRAVKSKVSQKT